MKPLAIIIMDGFGISPEKRGNAIASAHKPNLDRIWKSYPTATLASSGLAVGLPRGQMGNSEVGHLNLGAGRVVFQDYTRISLEVEKGTFSKNPVLLDAIEKGKNGKLHLIGLLSDGGVHSHNTHLYALLEMAKKNGLENVYVHAILDGRDVPPQSALAYFQELEAKFSEIGIGKVATVSGRYYTMDRDKRWERVEKAYRCLTRGVGLEEKTANDAVISSYKRGQNDEFLLPTVIDKKGLIGNGDTIIFFNFRPDRAREITRVFVDDNFREFARDSMRVHFVCMTQYDATLNAAVAYLPEDPTDTFGEIISRNGLTQLRIAETEKYAHVTYFFNGGKEIPNPGEERILIPSPKIATYDLLPKMSAFLVRDKVLECIDKDTFDIIVLNFANPDMVGHTGVFDAAVDAIEVVDKCVGEIVDKILKKGGAILLCADHGNAEKMIDEKTHQPHTAHTTNPVPFSLIISDGKNRRIREDGILADVAPTALDLLGLEKPKVMTGKSLIVD